MALSPIIMQPAYRYGAMTPWGGTRLGELYGRELPDSRTGESLEVSAISGLNSRDADGTPLCELINRYGRLLMGTDIKGDFPLLLKLIDAKDQLSVQVHPDDAYANKNEGKAGKTEAWVVLHALPGAELVYGIQEGVDRETLRRASEQGAAVEDLLRRVPVAAGDAFYIPAGTVHAIGAGIVLYEIQQSSDVTYRFYDWGRRDKHGNLRPLHLVKALDVTVLGDAPQAVVPKQLSLDSGSGTLERLFDTPFFVTDRYISCTDVLLKADHRRFSMLTALTETVLRQSDGKITTLMPGQTALLPAYRHDITATGDSFLISAPQVAG
ncbi:MAG TPA: mannose-6-phosphate isomerase [Clostridiales bacterium]|nr:mannose-6-phosphate isomerase [Clostridiales bacterium]